MTKKILLSATILFGMHQGLAQNTVNTDASKVSFEVSNMGFRTVEGEFTGMDGTVQFNENDLNNSSIHVCIDASTVNTENESRDEHLRNEDFFEVETYPTICFKSSSITKTEDGYMARGMLTMHGVSQEVSIPLTYSNKTLMGALEVDRTDYQVGSDGSFMVGKEVTLQIICVLK